MKLQFSLLYGSSAKNCAIVCYLTALHLKRSNARLTHSHCVIYTVTNSEWSKIYPIKVYLSKFCLTSKGGKYSPECPFFQRHPHVPILCKQCTLLVCLTFCSISCPLHREIVFQTYCIVSYLIKTCKFKYLQQYLNFFFCKQCRKLGFFENSSGWFTIYIFFFPCVNTSLFLNGSSSIQIVEVLIEGIPLFQNLKLKQTFYVFWVPAASIMATMLYNPFHKQVIALEAAIVILPFLSLPSLPLGSYSWTLLFGQMGTFPSEFALTWISGSWLLDALSHVVIAHLV